MEQGIKEITNFIFLEKKPKSKGVLIVPGTYRPQIIQKALEVYKSGKCVAIITTGGVSNPKQSVTEAKFQKKLLS